MTYIEFSPDEKRYNTGTPTGKETYDGVEDFINFVKERKLSVLVTDLGHVYGVGEGILASLAEASNKDIDRVEKELKDKLHWPDFASGYDPRLEVRTVGRFARHGIFSFFHEIGWKKRRR